MESYGIFFLLASISSNHLFQEEHHLYLRVQLEKQIPTYMHHHFAELMPFDKLRSKEIDF